MPELPPKHRETAIEILEYVRDRIAAASQGDQQLVFQMKRYIAKRLEFDERGTPMRRRKLKELKWKRQRGIRPCCNGELPERRAELDRIRAIDGYTDENTRLVCHACHRASQEERNFA